MQLSELKSLQKIPLYRKIVIAQARLSEFYNGDIFISFSGGKDSTVLLDIARKMYPNIKAVFSNTGLEYPEIIEFVKTYDNVDIIKPKLSFKQVVEKYGYAVVSKEIAHIMHGI